MTVPTHRRPLRIAAALALTAVFTAGYTAVGIGIAEATEAEATVVTACVDQTQGLWTAQVTFTNHWDGPTTVTLDGPAAAHEVHTLTTNGQTWTSHAYQTAGDAIHFNLTTDHPEHFHNNVPASIPRPAGCIAVATTVATSPATTTCEQANPPRDCTGAPETPPPFTTTPAPPRSAVPVPTTGAPPASADATTTAKATPAKTAAPALPTTGSNDVPVAVGAALAVLFGAAAILITRRRSAQ